MFFIPVWIFLACNLKFCTSQAIASKRITVFQIFQYSTHMLTSLFIDSLSCYCISHVMYYPVVREILTSQFGSQMSCALSALLVCQVVLLAHRLKWPLVVTMKMFMSTVVSFLCMPCRIGHLLVSLCISAEYAPGLPDSAAVLNYCEFGDSPTNGMWFSGEFLCTF